jgi:putative addiction module component (TIGR02574 family)
MDSNVEQVIAEALALAPDERSEVAAILRNSVADEIDESAVAQAWKEEIRRRIRALEAGETHTTPWEEVQARFDAA